MATNESPAYEQNAAAVVRKATECLPDILHESGTILYSSRETLIPGDYYFLGVNPGGSPEETDGKIQQSLDELLALTKKKNAYLEECWCGKECVGCCRPLQKRFEFLFRVVLEVKDPRSVCATNLIFQRSRVESELKNPRKLADICWPVHEVILKSVQPRAIITFGKLPFDFIWEQLHGSTPAAKGSGHGNWQWRSSKLKTGQVLIGLPHLSRYALRNNPQVQDEMRKLLGLPPRSAV